jgi:hypothetical protein
MLSVVMLNVVMLSVMAPGKRPTQLSSSLALKYKTWVEKCNELQYGINYDRKKVYSKGQTITSSFKSPSSDVITAKENDLFVKHFLGSML